MVQQSLRIPPQAPILFNATPLSLLRDVKELVVEERHFEDQIVNSVNPETATFSNTILPLAQAENDRHAQDFLTFYAQVSADEELRNASHQAEKLWQDADLERKMREDMFDLVDAVMNKNEEGLDPESRRLLKQKHQSFTQNGLALPIEKRSHYTEIQMQLSQLKIDIRKNMNEENEGIWFNLEELEGVPQDVLSEAEEAGAGDDRKFRFKFDYTVYIPIMRHALKDETRMEYYLAFSNRCEQNVPLLKQIILLRDEAARLLGYSHHAEYRLQDRMAKHVDAVNPILDELRSKLVPAGYEAVQKLKVYKKIDLESRGKEYDGHFYLWDSSFYSRLMLEKEYSIDMQKVSEYFSLETTIRRMLTAFEKMFGLVFTEITEAGRSKIAPPGRADELVWHEDVHMYSVWWDEREGGDFCGHLYMDLHPRVGKYDNPSNWSLRRGFTNSAGQRTYPATALVCGFTKPTATKPSLLKHYEVVLLFHELGHGIHELVSKTTYARFHGTAGVEDFCELPSIMLEQFCQTPALKDFTQHYSTLSAEYFKVWESEQSQPLSPPPSAQMPTAMLESLLQTRKSNISLYYLRMLHAAIYDMEIHQPSSHSEAEALNLSAIYNTLNIDLVSMEGPTLEHYDGLENEWGHGEATFTQIIGPYDVGCFGYITATLYALDIFRTFFSPQPSDGNKSEGNTSWNVTEARRYRRMILEPGASRDEKTMLREYLGREVDFEAFWEEVGLNTE